MRETVVVFSHLPWNFPCDYVKQTCLELAKRAKVILFNPQVPFSFWKFLLNRKAREKYYSFLGREKTLRIYKFFPLGILPLQRFKIIEKTNIIFGLLFFKIFYLFHFGLQKPILWTFSSELKDLIPKKRKILIYDRVDQIASLDPEDNKRMKEQDHSLLEIADYIFVNSPYAFRYVKKYNQASFLVPCGCAVNLFSGHKIIKPREIKKNKRPIIGLIGSLDHRLDFEIIYPLAQKRKDWDFVFIGTPLSNDLAQFKLINLKSWLNKLKKLHNIYFLGKKPKEKIPNFIANFDVCLIPYKTSLEFVKGCNPMKLYEYLAMSKPVVSTPIEAVKQCSPTVKIANDASGFEKAIEKFLRTQDNKDEIEKRKMIASENSWEEKAQKMWEIISA